MEQVYCMQNAFSPIVFSEESDEEQRLCGAAQSSRFIGDPSKSLCGAADDDEGDTGTQSNVTAIERGTDWGTRNIREGTWRSDHMCVWSSAPSSRTADGVIWPQLDTLLSVNYTK